MNIDRESAISAFETAIRRERSRSHFMNPGIALHEDGTVTYASGLNPDDDVVRFDDWENGDGWGIEDIPEMTDDEICKAAEACAELYEDSVKYFEPEEEEEED